MNEIKHSETDFQAKLSQAVLMIEKKGKEYAQAKAISWQLQELRKTVLACEVAKIGQGSFNDRESMARSSEIYRQHLEGTKQAIEKELTLKAECERWSAQYEALRSLCSLEGKKIGLV